MINIKKKFLNYITLTGTTTPSQNEPGINYIMISSSSSYRVGSTDIPDPLSPLLPIVHRPRQVFRTTTCILT